MLGVIDSDDDEKRGDKKIKKGCKAGDKRNWWKIPEDESKKYPHPYFNNRILPGYFTLASSTGSSLGDEAHNRDKLTPRKSFIAGKALRATTEGHARVVARCNYI